MSACYTALCGSTVIEITWNVSQRLLELAIDKFGLSARAYTRILKVARTIADLEGQENIQPAHLSEAIQYRTLDRNLIA